MVVHRINASQHEHPNPYINFIGVLGDGPTDKLSKSKTYDDTESARHIMRAIAAQVVPIMKAHGMGLNSFNEYEWNSEFAGRNWNGGEIIELVLRRKDGRFLPMGYLLTVMAHELAHIHHMNHGPKFQQLNLQLRQEIRKLQSKGYFGPGFWSSGQRLKDSVTLAGDANLSASDLPEYTCGGSQRQGARRRVYRPRAVKKRKLDRFQGEGQKLEPAGVSFFRKRANAAAAKDARALAAEKRMQTMQDSTSKPIQVLPPAEVDLKSFQSRSSLPGTLGVNNEIEIIELEDEWQDFDPQDLKSGEALEDEKVALRDEMKHLLTDFRDLQQARSPHSTFEPKAGPSVSNEVIIDDDSEDEIQILSLPIIKLGSQARKAEPPSHLPSTRRSKLPRLSQNIP